MNDRILIVFVKNPIPGRVKTRLAKDSGNAKAVSVYKQLLAYTRKIIAPLPARLAIWYGDTINHDDLWNGLDKHQQPQGDLGERMSGAVEHAFRTSSKVCIIGSDCPQLRTEILQDAFDALENHDFVIGPAHDGGYYLLGMRAFQPSVFEMIDWSTPAVLSQTITHINELHATYQLLPMLRDVDDVDDMHALGIIIP